MAEIDFPREKYFRGPTNPKKHSLSESDASPPVKKPKIPVSDKKLKKKKNPKTLNSPKELSKNSRYTEQNKNEICYFNHQNLVVDMPVIGIVKEISDHELIVALPNGYEGKVTITNLCDSYNKTLKRLSLEFNDDDLEEIGDLQEIFHIGRIVKCLITAVTLPKLGSRKRDTKISLTLNPHRINSYVAVQDLKTGMEFSGFVSSIEDKGYVVDIGLPSVKAFLHKKDTDKSLKIGAYIDCYIRNAPGSDFAAGERRTVSLGISVSASETASIHKITSLPFNSICPGIRVNVTITQVLKQGLIVKLLNYYGSISKEHCGTELANFSKNQKLAATVLFVQPLSKLIALSFLPHLVNPQQMNQCPVGGLRRGDIIRDAKVKKISALGSVSLKLKEDVLGVIEKNHISESELNEIRKCMETHSSLSCRVLSLNYIENSAVVSSKRSILNLQVMNLSDLRAGLRVNCIVRSMESSGARVTVAGNISGFIPSLHLSDIPLKHPEKKYPEGSILKCRVLSVNHESKDLVLTNKQTLVSSTLPIICDENSLKVGKQTEGFISAITKTGFLVTFYNCFKGFLKKIHLDKSQADSFFIGQVLTCYISSINSEGFISLSLKPINVENVNSENYEIGKVDGCIIERQSNSGFYVVLSANSEIAFLPKGHLSDDLSNIELLWKLYKPGDRISQVTQIRVEKSLIVSAKASLIQACVNKTAILCPENLEKNSFIIANICKVYSHGILLESFGGIVGMANIRDSDVAAPLRCDSVFKKNQTISAKVLSIDPESKKIQFTVQKSMCCSESTELTSGFNFMQNYFQECLSIRKMLERDQSVSNKALLKYKTGDLIEVVIKTVNEHSASASTDDGLDCDSDPMDNSVVTKNVNERVEVAVLHIDFLSENLTVSFDSRVIESLKSHQESKFTQLYEDQTIKSQVLYIHGSYVLSMLTESSIGKLVYVPSKQHINECQSHNNFIIGQENRIIFKNNLSDFTLCSLKMHEKNFKMGASSKKLLNSIVDARIVNVLPYQLIVQISPDVFGKVHISQIDDSFLMGQKPMDKFKRKNMIKIRVISFLSDSHIPASRFKPKSHQQVFTCSAKPSLLNKKKIVALESSFQIGQNVPVFIKQVKKKSLDVVIDEKTKGKISAEHASDKEKIQLNLSEYFKVGQAFNAKVLNLVKQNVLLLSLLSDEKKENKSDSDLSIRQISKPSSPCVDETRVFHAAKKQRTSSTCESSGDLVSPSNSQNRLTLQDSFEWENDTSVNDDTFTMDSDSDTSDLEQKVTPDVKPSQNTKPTNKLPSYGEADCEIIDNKTAEPSKSQMTSNDFDRLVLQSPDNSALWLQYMAYQLENNEVEKARHIAWRALNTISFREEREKLNVWVALMNLENMYGTFQSLNDVFQKALQHNSQKDIYQQLINIYVGSSKIELAEQLYSTMLKKFSGDKSIWFQFGLFFFKNGNLSSARKLMQRSLKSLPKKDHIDIIKNFALNEFTYGDTERGKTMFENIVSCYPKRTDIWSIYIDSLVKKSEIVEARNVYERIMNLDIAAKKIKFILKKYIDFERSFGTSETELNVKSRVFDLLGIKSV